MPTRDVDTPVTPQEKSLEQQVWANMNWEQIDTETATLVTTYTATRELTVSWDTTAAFQLATLITNAVWKRECVAFPTIWTPWQRAHTLPPLEFFSDEHKAAINQYAASDECVLLGAAQ